MPIQELPKATRRLLSSSQVLTTPASLVKELIDNALDAKATSIDVIISANSVDRIEVRDNGHGIAPEDIGALGKHGHTSKLRNFEELRTLAGQSLGFRGEALASAVELGDVSITTRTEGEGVATCIKLNPLGFIESQTSISHPVGTTVCVVKFFSRLPVRRQNALRDTNKTMSSIKEILQSYALARLNVRLTLKVLKSSIGNWSFIPLRPNDGIKYAVSQVIGRDTVAQCVEKISPLSIPIRVDAEYSGSGSGSSAFLKGESSGRWAQTDFVIHAFLPKPDADLTKISGGQFVSIDSRPVSAARGTMKKIVSIYKATMLAFSVDDKLKKAKHPFIRLNIACPAGSYDPNIEPAKDNVLFEDEQLLLSLVEDWFRNMYGGRLSSITASNGPSTASAMAQSTSGVERATLSAELDVNSAAEVDFYDSSSANLGFQSLESSSLDDGDANSAPGSELELRGNDEMPILSTICEAFDTTQAADQGNSALRMSEHFQDEFDLDSDEQMTPCNEVMVEYLREKHISRNFNSLDPWVIAKLNASVVKKKMNGDSHVPDPTREITCKQPPSTPFMLTTTHIPMNSQPSPESCPPLHLERSLCDDTGASDNLQRSLEGWLKQNHAVSSGNSPYLHSRSFPSLESLDMGNGIPARDVLYGMPKSQPTGQGHLVLNRQKKNCRSFVSLLKDSKLLISPSSSSVTEQRVKSLPQRRPQHNGSTSGMTIDVDTRDHLPRNESQLEVYEALEFERRKEAATHKLREELRQSQSFAVIPSNLGQATTGSSLHKTRCHASVAALKSNQSRSSVEATKPTETCLPGDDSQVYLMRRQKLLTTYPENAGSGRKLKRARTMLLPLETTPSRTELHSLSQVIPSDVNHIRKILFILAGHDEYVKSGNQAMGLDVSTADIAIIEKKVENILQRWVQGKGVEQLNILLDLRSLQGRSTIDA